MPLPYDLYCISIIVFDDFTGKEIHVYQDKPDCTKDFDKVMNEIYQKLKERKENVSRL